MQVSFRRLPEQHNRVWLVAATYAVTLQGAVSGPLTARILGPAGRGQLAVILTTAYVVTGLACLGFPAVLSARASRYPDAAIRAAVRPWLLISTGVSLLAIPAVWIAATAVGVSPLRLLPAMSLAALLNGMAAIQTGRLIAARCFLRLFMARVIGSTLVIVGLITVQQTEGSPLLVAQIYLLAGVAPAFARPLRSLRQRTAEQSDLKEVATVLREDVPRLSVASFLNLSNARVDQILLPIVMSNASLGIYAVAVNYGTLVAPLGAAIATGLTLKAAARHAPQVAFSIKDLLLPLLAAGALMLLAPIVIQPIFGSSFHGAIVPSIVLTGAGVLLSAIAIVGGRLTAFGQSSLLIPGELAALASLPLTLPLSARLGALGASVAACISYAANLGALALMIRRHRGKAAGIQHSPQVLQT